MKKIVTDHMTGVIFKEFAKNVGMPCIETIRDIINRYHYPTVYEPYSNRVLSNDEFELDIDMQGNLVATYYTDGGFTYLDVE